MDAMYNLKRLGENNTNTKSLSAVFLSVCVRNSLYQLNDEILTIFGQSKKLQGRKSTDSIFDVLAAGQIPKNCDIFIVSTLFLFLVSFNSRVMTRNVF